MSYWICCNSCFHSPSADRKLAVTTCGHLICNVCYQKVTQGTCLICNIKCQVAPISDKSSFEVKEMFSDINTVADKYFTEISQVIVFQAKHQRRLLSYYQQRNDNLEQMLVKMKQEMQQMMKKQSEQSAYIKKLENTLHYQSVKTSSAAPKNHTSFTHQGPQPVLKIPFNSPMTLFRHSSSANLAENMELEETSLFRKPNDAPRLSLTSPPQDGRMGTVTHRPTSHSASSATVRRFQTAPITPKISFGHTSGWKSPIFKSPSTFRHSSMSSLVNLPP